MTYADSSNFGSEAIDTGDYGNTAAASEGKFPAHQPQVARSPIGVQRDLDAAHSLSRMMSRALDITGALALLVIAFPFLVLIAIALQLDSPGRLFFVHQRVGYGGRLFPCFKFRTMIEDAEEALARHLAGSEEAKIEWQSTFKLQDDPRVTSLGRTVRKLSLDEFPQLLNVLRGEMSLVGPRPIVSEEIPFYGRYFAEYCRVRPGLTGLWQISGRNDMTYRRRVSIDTVYVRRKSLALDLVILARTFPAVVAAKGSY